VDVLGLVIAVVVAAASMHDNAVGIRLVDKVAIDNPSVTKAWVDAGFKNAVAEHAAPLGIDVQTVHRDPQTRGFVPLPKRWVVEDRHQRCRSSDDRCSWGVSWGGVGVGPASAGVVAGRVVA
jgi:transposase